MNRLFAARKFIKQNKLKRDFSYDILKTIAEKQGYRIYEFIRDLPKDRVLFEKINCLSMAEAGDSFSYNESGVKLIFIRRSCTEAEKKAALFHENIHISLGHLDQSTPISVIQKKLTTDIHFISELLLKYSGYTKAFITAILFTAVFAMGLSTTVQTAKKVYITPGGTHYHRSTCTYVVNNPNAFTVTLGKTKNLYLPCSVCNPDK